MRLPFMQLESDLVAHGASTVAALAGCSVPQALGHIALLRAWAVSRATDEAPPDGMVPGDAAPRLVEAAAQWAGEKGALLQALVDAGQVERLPDGLRVLHLNPYVTAWERNAKAKARMANARERSANKPVTDGERSAKFGGQTQTQTQTQREEDLSASRSAGAEASGDDLPDATEHAHPAERPPLVLEPSPSDAPPEEPKRRPKPAKAATGDPRHAPLVEALCEAAPGYAFTGGRDAKAISRLLELADALPGTAGNAAPLEVVRRWRIARAWQGFPMCRHLGDLADNWNAYAAPQRPQRGRMDTTPSDFKNMPEGGIDLGEYIPGGAT